MSQAEMWQVVARHCVTLIAISILSSLRPSFIALGRITNDYKK
jgi:hypothetical protein